MTPDNRFRKLPWWKKGKSGLECYHTCNPINDAKYIHIIHLLICKECRYKIRTERR